MSPTAMRRNVRLIACLALIALIAPAHAQVGPTATVTVALQTPDIANGTGVVIADIGLDIAGQLCTNPPTFAIQLLATNDAGFPVDVAPGIIEMSFDPDEALVGASSVERAVITIGPAPAGAIANLTLDALPPTGGCGDVQRSGDSDNTTVRWVDTRPADPERLMPAPGLPLLVLALAAARRGGPKKPRSISSS